jgi:hypothetical protein
VTSYEWHQARRSWAWLVVSREYSNFTYELTTENVVEMAWFVAAVTGLEFDESFGYIEELHNDQALLDHLRRAAADSPLRRVMDPEPRYGRRAAWYAIVRAHSTSWRPGSTRDSAPVCLPPRYSETRTRVTMAA